MEPAEIRDSVLRFYYDLEQRVPTKSVWTGDAAKELGLSAETVSSAIAYLQQKGFLEIVRSVRPLQAPTAYLAKISALGTDHVEARSLRSQPKSKEERKVVFISCGQYTDDEIQLGLAMADAIDELTPHRGYFAQKVSSFETLSNDILQEIQNCVGFVAIMHNRGEIETPERHKIMRASVWIEQEIAIAAFVQQRLGQRIDVKAYLQSGISREGLRQQLHLNVTHFSKNSEVIEDFRKHLVSGAFGGSTRQPTITEEERRHRELFEPHISILPETIKNQASDDRFAVVLRNDGNGSAFNISMNTHNSSDGNIVLYPPPATLSKDKRHVLITKHPQTRVEIVPIVLAYEDKFGQKFESKSGRDFVLGSKYEFRKVT